MARARDKTEAMLDLLAEFDGDFNDFEPLDDDDLDLEALREAIAAWGVEPVADAYAMIKAALTAFGTVDAWAARFDDA